MKKTIAIASTLALGLLATGCSAADTAAHNTSVKAENFEVQREIVVINTRSDETLAHVQGRCSIESGSGASDMPGWLQIQCKHGEGDYRKHFIRDTPDAWASSMQLGSIDVNQYNTTWLIRPETVIPEIEVETSR